jgi:hypothetical protein
VRARARTFAPAPTRARAPARLHAAGPARAGSAHASADQSAVLDLQRDVGNQAVASLLGGGAGVLRAGPGKAGGSFKPIADIDAMTLKDFDDYAKAIVDWSLDPTLPKARKKSLTDVLEFARSGDPQPLEPCAEMPLTDIEGTKLKPDVRTKLRAYARAVNGKDSAGTESTAVLARGLQLGDGLIKLEAHVPKGPLRHTMGEEEAGRQMLAALIDAGEVERFGRYVARSGAYLEAPDGTDQQSYLDMVQLPPKKHPDEYIGKLRRVHNYHRFLPGMLDTLIDNEKDHSRSKPLALILHAGSDHNGAFHRDAELERLVQHPRNLTLMVEGAATLEDVGDEAARIAHDYGKNRRIQQLMLAGHGSPVSMGMAGRPDKSGRFPVSQKIQVQANRARTEKFIKGLMKHMDTGPDSRIVLNACLTAADQINTPLDPDPVKARAQVQAALKADPNVAGLVRQFAPGGTTVEGNVSSVPAGKYMEEVGGVPTGKMHQIIDVDPHAGTSDRAEYIEFGEEAEGCMKAVLAHWGDKGTAAMLAAIQKRLDRVKAPAGWDPNLINIFYEMVKAKPDDAARMQVIANEVARGLSEFDQVTEMKPSGAGGVQSLSKGDEDTLWKRMYPVGKKQAQLAIDQVWMDREATRQAFFMTALDTKFATTQDAEPHLDESYLAGSMAKLLPIADAKTPSKAQMKLAMWAAASIDTPNPDAVAFLKANAVGTTLTLPVGVASVKDLTGSIGDDAVLKAIGLIPKAGGGGGGGGGEPPNYDLDGDGVDDIYIRSVTRRGMVTARYLNVRERPDVASTRIDAMPAGHRVEVFGVVGDWFAIEHRGRVAFVHSSWVRASRVA